MRQGNRLNTPDIMIHPFAITRCRHVCHRHIEVMPKSKQYEIVYSEQHKLKTFTRQASRVLTV